MYLSTSLTFPALERSMSELIACTFHYVGRLSWTIENLRFCVARIPRCVSSLVSVSATLRTF